MKGTFVIGSHCICFESIIGWKIEVWSGGKMIGADLITSALWPYSPSKSDLITSDCDQIAQYLFFNQCVWLKLQII